LMRRHDEDSPAWDVWGRAGRVALPGPGGRRADSSRLHGLGRLRDRAERKIRPSIGGHPPRDGVKNCWQPLCGPQEGLVVLGNVFGEKHPDPEGGVARVVQSRVEPELRDFLRPVGLQLLLDLLSEAISLGVAVAVELQAEGCQTLFLVSHSACKNQKQSLTPRSDKV